MPVTGKITRLSSGGSLTFQAAFEAGGWFSASVEFQLRDLRTCSRDIAAATDQKVSSKPKNR